MEFKITIDASKDVLEAISSLADALKGLSNTQTAETVVTEKPKKVTKAEVKEEEVAEEPIQAKKEESLKLEDVRALAQKVAQSGKRDEIKDLLGEYNVNKVTDLEEADYQAFYEKLNTL
jgi:hypothetical protein